MRSKQYSVLVFVSTLSLGLSACQPKSSGNSAPVGIPQLNNPLEKKQTDSKADKKKSTNAPSAPDTSNPANGNTSTNTALPPAPSLNPGDQTQPPAAGENKSDSVDGLPFALKNSCALQICGDPSKTFMPSDILLGQTKEDAIVNDFFEKRLRPELEKIYSTQLAYAQKTQNLLEAAVPRFKQVQLTKPYRALLNVFWTFTGFGTYSGAVRAGKPAENKRYVIDLDTLKKLATTMTAADQDLFAKFLEDILNSDEFALSGAAQQMPFKDVAALIFPKLDASQAQLMLALHILKPIQDLQTAFPELTIATPEGLNAIVSGQTLTPELEASILNSYMLALIGRAVTERADLYSSRDVRVADIANEIKESGIIEKKRQQLSNASDLSWKKAAAFNSCRVLVNRSAQAAPTNEDLQKTDQMIAAVKGSVLNISKGLSDVPELQKKMESDVQKIQFNLPYAKEQMFAGFTARTKSSIDELTKQLGGVDKLTDASLLMMTYAERNGEGATPDTSINTVCGLFAPGGITDNAVSALGKINLSWQTVKLRKFSAGVIAHELGHILSAVLKETNSTTYESMRDCTNTRHSSIDKAHDKVYLEEDFADMIASLVLKDIRAQKVVESGNFGCLLMGKSNGRWGEESGLTMKWADGVLDPHSPNLFRALQVNVTTREPLPASCQTIVDSYVPSAQQQCPALDKFY